MALDSLPRSIPRWLAGVVQELELTRPRFVTVDDIARILAHSRPVVRNGILELTKRGWLRPTGIRATYEFIPGEAAGPFPSGDRWLVLRAELESHPGAFHVGATSAAWLRGYAQRAPKPHIVVARSETWIPRPLRANYTVLLTCPAPASDQKDGLPLPTPSELVAEVAQLAPRLQLDAAQGWLRRLFDDTTPEDVAETLRDRSPATRARAGYFAEVCGAQSYANAIAAVGNGGAGPYYTGPRYAASVGYAPRWRVHDSGHVA